LKFEDSFLFVKNKRPQIFPNFGFQKQLKRLEITLGMISEEQYLQETKYKSVMVL
jgi:hypothetical protein